VEVTWWGQGGKAERSPVVGTRGRGLKFSQETLMLLQTGDMSGTIYALEPLEGKEGKKGGSNGRGKRQKVRAILLGGGEGTESRLGGVKGLSYFSREGSHHRDPDIKEKFSNYDGGYFTS